MDTRARPWNRVALFAAALWPISGGLTASEAVTRCATPEPTAEERVILEVETPLSGAGPACGCPVTDAIGPIPVWVHVVHDGSNGDVPEQWIHDQIDVLNDSFAETLVSFALAGVTRTDDPTWFTAQPGSAAEIAMTNALAVSPESALNLYTLQPGGGLLGWSTFPWSYAEDSPRHDVVVFHATLPGGSADPFALGINAVHEVGHYLGLYHTFQGGCVAGDQVADTPAESQPASGCPEGQDTCPAPGLDPIHNFMDDSDDSCRNTFTPGQAARWRSLLPVYRPTLAAIGCIFSDGFESGDELCWGGP